MKFPLVLVLSLSAVLPLRPQTPPSETPKPIRNDNLYPPVGEARKFIDYDGAGFTIAGRRTYLASGTIHYPRVPSGLWADRLTRMKNANFRGVETYLFWNALEPREDEWDFTGENNFEAFLTLAQNLGLYAIVRVGPYVCAEWDSGGWPVWLRFKPAMTLRTDDPEFLKWNDHYLDKILPMVARHQINHGGNVVLVQVENEHRAGWGVVRGLPYFDHLEAETRKDGIEVPMFMSGLNHGGNPSPGVIDPSTRTSPWFSTEFWAGWFDAYRILPQKKVREIDDANWRILAHGGGGHNFYMLHGGSNFGTWNDNSTGASYDYGAAIGQAGDLRLIYYRMKRANQLAQSFPDVLANSQEAPELHGLIVPNPAVEVLGARKSRAGAGALVFVRNKTGSPADVNFSGGGSLALAPHGVYPIPVYLAIAPGVRIVSSTFPVLARAVNQGVVTVVVYGQAGEKGRVELESETPARIAARSGDKVDISVPANLHSLPITIPESGISEVTLEQSVPERSIRVLAINQDLTLRTWLLGAPGNETLVFGPAYVQEVSADGRAVTFERPYGQPAGGRIAVYGKRGPAIQLASGGELALDDQPAPNLSAWEMIVAPESAPTYDDHAWLATETPMPMGADGDNGAFAWYRTTVDLPAAAKARIQFQARNNATVFVNGRPVDPLNAPAEFAAGRNVVAVLASHVGRDKAFNYCGAPAENDPKGIVSGVTLEIPAHPGTVLTGWRMRGGLGGAPASLKDWRPLANVAGQPAFYRATFTTTPPGPLGAHPILRVTYSGLSRGMIWLNGHALGRYPEKIRIDSLYLPETWLRSGVNDLVIFDETGASPLDVKLVVEREASREVLSATEPIDLQTPIVVPAENPPRDLVKQNAGNLAWHAPAEATSAAADAPASAATDGDMDTRWSVAKGIVTGAITVDLGRVHPVKVCEISWDGAQKNYRYLLEGSADGQTWRKLGDQTTAVPTPPDSPSELSRLNLTGDPVRLLRVSVPNNKSISLTEIRAFE